MGLTPVVLDVFQELVKQFETVLVELRIRLCRELTKTYLSGCTFFNKSYRYS
jgi:hypothetical protein